MSQDQGRNAVQPPAVALSAHDLCVSLGTRRVLESVSADIISGQWTAIVGPNGAGKSTLLAALAGILRPQSGEVLVAGAPLAGLPARERARCIAWLAQQGEAEGELLARDVVRLGRLPHHGLLGAMTRADEQKVDAAMADTECSAFAARRLSELSGGERQRVLLARALAVGAPVLLLDEPTTHLDAPHQRAVVRTLRRLVGTGAAVASVVHDPMLALAADRLIVLEAGRVRATGSPHDPSVREALTDVFDQAFSIEQLTREGRSRWIALPDLGG
jgi:iron complex transport system ATP-binding protein